MVDIDTFTTAAANGDISRVKQMLENGVNPNGINRYGRTAMQVMKMGCPDICRVLLNGGADPDRQDGYSIALIHDLAREGHLDTLKVLVEVGKANINLRDGNDKGAIDLARENNYHNVMDYLFRRSQATKVGV